MKSTLYGLLVLSSLFFSIYEKSLAQAPDWQWARSVGSITGYGQGNGLTTDASGNIYTTGIYSGIVDFDPGAGTCNFTTTGMYDLFIYKLDASGNFIWAKAIGGYNNDAATSITCDTTAGGAIYIVGTFSGTVDFDPDSGIFNLVSTGSTSAFLLKLDTAGNFIWAKAFTGNGTVRNQSITVDLPGNIYITGKFNGTIDFDPGPGIFNFPMVNIYDVAHITKLDTSGNLIWAKALAGDNCNGRFILADHTGQLFLTGDFGGTVDFDPGPGNFNLTAAGGVDVFICKMDTAGNLVWIKAVGGPLDDVGYSLAADASSNIYITGFYYSTADFNPGTGVFNLTTAGSSDVFILKLSFLGNFLWAKSIGSTGLDGATSILVDAFGFIYITGEYRATADFDPGPGIYNLTPLGISNFFLAKLNSGGGNLVWAKSTGGTVSDIGRSMIMDISGNIYETGFLGSPSILFGQDTITVTSISGIFTSRLSNSIAGIKNIESKGIIAFYPNPASGHLTIIISGNNKIVAITITDITGITIRMIKTETNSSGSIEVSTSDFDGGIYFVGIKTKDFNETKKLIVVK